MAVRRTTAAARDHQLDRRGADGVRRLLAEAAGRARGQHASPTCHATSFADLDKGIDASWISSAWAPSYFAPGRKSSLGDWRAAALPQWTAGANVAADWGGSTYPVFSQSKHPAQAAEFAEWLTGTERVVGHHQDAAVLTVPDLPAAAQRAVVQGPSTYPLSGISTPNVVFSAAASSIKGMPWPPFMTQALTQSATCSPA